MLAVLAAVGMLRPPMATPWAVTTSAFGRATPRAAIDADAVGPDDDLFAIIGAPRTATAEEIRRAYRKRARILHPDVPGGDAAQFRRLVQAFETLMDSSRRAEWDTARKRSSARARANRAWDDINGKSSRWRGDGDASERPAGSRWDAERRADTREESDARRTRWREMVFEQVWRDHMPLDHKGMEARRIPFIAALETTVQAFVRDESASDTTTYGSAFATMTSEEEASELKKLLQLTNREVLRAELQDATHRASRHRDRARWLESELAQAEHKASIWRGATPASEADRVQAMQRELDFLELARRLRGRLSDQRLALQQLKVRDNALRTRLATLAKEAYT